jgi:RpiB/LacA/LacB family sugar-phosphate isomerase
VKIAIGADHAGFELKQLLSADLARWGHAVEDLGTHSTAPCDYPDFAAAVARAVVEGRAERGVVLCGSGVGACVAANKVFGSRAGLCHDTYSGHQCVEHDDVNVLVMGARVVGAAVAQEVLRAFVDARYTREERHAKRLAKVLALERAMREGA